MIVWLAGLTGQPTMDHSSFITRTLQLAQQAREDGNCPFGSLIVVDGEVVVEAGNTAPTTGDPTGHAEINVVRMAAARLSPEALRRSTLYTSTEPCAMCAGAIYWSGIARVVYALPESELRILTGANPANLTLQLPCREVFSRGQRDVEVVGPVGDVEEAKRPHKGFWDIARRK